MGKQTYSTAITNPIRTAAQGGVGWLATEFVDAWLYDMNDRQYGISVLVIGALASLIQNALENKAGWAFLRAIPPTKAPIVDEAPTPVEDSELTDEDLDYLAEEEYEDDIEGENADLPQEPVWDSDPVYADPNDAEAADLADKEVNPGH